MKDIHKKHVELAVAYKTHKIFRQKYDKLRKELAKINSKTYGDIEMKYNDVHLNYDVNMTSDIIPQHSHAFTEILYCEGGSVGYLLGGRKFRFSKGDLIFIRPGTPHQPLFSEHAQYPYERYALWISDSFMQKMSENIESIRLLDKYLDQNQQFLFHLNEEESYKTETILESIIKEYKEERIGWETMILSKVLELMIDFCRIIMYHETNKKETANEDLIDQIISYINKNLSEKITMDALSEKFYVSTSTIYNHFTEKLHVSPYKFILQRRLIKAKNLILQGEQLNSIWQQCGFSDYSTFYRAFRKEYSISPKKYRELLSQENI
ncbi:MAG: AraC family transcriptional regulator [Clostridiales bacterium]|nr:AraC family transcriptional regulator [Clostridiales bacterium]